MAERQAASGYVDYDAATGRYSLPPEQAAVFADGASPAFMAGAFRHRGRALSATSRRSRRRSAPARAWAGTSTTNACSTALRALLPPRLRQQPGGGVVAGARRRGRKARARRARRRRGCGHGASTIIMAKAFPKSTFSGFDYHDASIARGPGGGRAGRRRRPRQLRGRRGQLPGKGYDLVTFFDCLHDMGDPVGAARHVRESLAPGRHLDARRADRRRPRRGQPEPGRPDLLLGLHDAVHARLADARRSGWRSAPRPARSRLVDVIRQGGFSQVRVAAQTPFNMVLEARP